LSSIIEAAADELVEAFTTLLFLQFNLALPRLSIVHKLFHVNELQWTEFCSPFGISSIMLFEPMCWVFADANVKALSA
jgi:hypothetical protein